MLLCLITVAPTSPKASLLSNEPVQELPLTPRKKKQPPTTTIPLDLPLKELVPVLPLTPRKRKTPMEQNPLLPLRLRPNEKSLDPVQLPQSMTARRTILLLPQPTMAELSTQTPRNKPMAPLLLPHVLSHADLPLETVPIILWHPTIPVVVVPVPAPTLSVPVPTLR